MTIEKRVNEETLTDKNKWRTLTREEVDSLIESDARNNGKFIEEHNNALKTSYVSARTKFVGAYQIN